MEETLQKQLQTLSRLYKESDHLYSDFAARLGMTGTAFWILYALSHAEQPLTQNDLCNMFFFPVQTINSSIGALQKKGLLKLQAIPGTKNRKEILLTKAGQDFSAGTIRKVDEIEENAFLLFTAEEREIYLSLFKRHIENLKQEEQRVLSTLTEDI